MTASIRSTSDASYLQHGGQDYLVLSSDSIKAALGKRIEATSGPLNSQLAGIRNAIINGGCRVSQRGNVAYSGVGSFAYGGVDRIPAWSTGFGSVTGTIAQGSGSGVYHQVLASLTTTGSGSVGFLPRLEAMDTKRFNGKTVTFSCEVYQDVGTPTSVTLSLSKATAVNVFDTNTAIGIFNTGALTSGQWTKVSGTLTLGSTDGDNGLQLNILFAIGAVTSKSLAIRNLQLEEGDRVTPFGNSLPYGLELALCQRYYETGSIGQTYQNYAPTGVLAVC